MTTCPVTNGEHDWREGGARDFGRYHCAACQKCLYVSSLIQEERKARQRLAELEAECSKLRGLIHSEMLTTMEYCETCEMSYQRPMESERPCPYCRVEELEADCAQMSEELGLPPTIRPAEGELSRMQEAARMWWAATKGESDGLIDAARSDTVARIAAWLRKESPESFSNSKYLVLEQVADAIERGEWKEEG